MTTDTYTTTIMKTPLTAVLAIHPHAYKRIADQLGVSRQHVREVAHGERSSARVTAALTYILKHRRLPR